MITCCLGYFTTHQSWLTITVYSDYERARSARSSFFNFGENLSMSDGRPAGQPWSRF